MYHQSWLKWGGVTTSSELDFIKKSAMLNDLPLTDADTIKNRKGPWLAYKKALAQYVLSWYIDLVVFRLLTYEKGKTFLIPFYDPGNPAPRF